MTGPARPDATTPPLDVRTISTADEFLDHAALMQDVWGMSTPLVSVELLAAISHAGGYVAAAFDGDRMVGASVGFLARHQGASALHSHVTGVVESMRHAGVGRSIKFHQRDWAAERDIDWITWTFDPLVRRNAWFNIAVLGAHVHSYLPDFYGTMTDAINAGDASDRLYIAWRVAAPLPDRPRDGRGVGDAVFVPTPDDVVAMRRTDPAEVARWRRSTRDALTGALGAGRCVLGFTADGNYVIGSGT